MFGLSLLPPAEVRDCFALVFTSNLPKHKRVEQFCDYLLENYTDADSNFLHTFGPKVLHHQWGPLTDVNHSKPISMQYFTVSILIFLFLYLHCKTLQNETCIEVRSVTTRRLENQLQSKQGTSAPQKLDSKGITWFLESNFFHQSRIYFYQTHVLFLNSCIHNDTCHFSHCARYCTEDNRYCAFQKRVS